VRKNHYRIDQNQTTQRRRISDADAHLLPEIQTSQRGMTRSDFDALQSTKKPLPSLPNQAAQILQDFGAGSPFLWPLLNSAKDFDSSWTDPPLLRIFLSGATLFALAYLTRHLTRPR
jgi:hypothetical protein